MTERKRTPGIPRKLTMEQAREIRVMVKSPEWSYYALGRKFKVNPSVIRSLVLGQTYKEEAIVE